MFLLDSKMSKLFCVIFSGHLWNIKSGLTCDIWNLVALKLAEPFLQPLRNVYEKLPMKNIQSYKTLHDPGVGYFGIK